MQTGVNHTSETFLSLHHQGGEGLLLCAAVDFAGDDAPEWIHLLPAGELRTADNRGPFKVEPAATLILNSIAAGDRLPIDENHATDLAAPKGLPAPARGWIVELQPRADGIWGKVEWTAAGRNLVRSKAYRGISPVLDHRRSDGVVFALRRASLVNRPNLKGLATLHSEENTMTLFEKLLAALKLPTATSEDALVTAVTTLHAEHAAQTTTLHAVAKAAGLDDKADGAKIAETVTQQVTTLHAVAKAAGLDDKADAAKVAETVTLLMSANAGDKDQAIVSLQSELSTTTITLNALVDEGKRDKAETFVDRAIAGRKVGVSALRDHYVTRHMADPAAVEKELNGLPSLGGTSHTTLIPPASTDGKVTLHAEQKAAARLLGISEADMLKTIEAEQAQAALH